MNQDDPQSRSQLTQLEATIAKSLSISIRESQNSDMAFSEQCPVLPPLESQQGNVQDADAVIVDAQPPFNTPILSSYKRLPNISTGNSKYKKSQIWLRSIFVWNGLDWSVNMLLLLHESNLLLFANDDRHGRCTDARNRRN